MLATACDVQSFNVQQIGTFPIGAPRLHRKNSFFELKKPAICLFDLAASARTLLSVSYCSADELDAFPPMTCRLLPKIIG